VKRTLRSAATYLYRNKMEFSFSSQRWLTKNEIESGQTFDKSFALGLHAPRQFAKIIDLEECHLQSMESREIVNRVRALARQSEWAPWDTRGHTGLLRHLVIREGKRTGDRMVNLVTSRRDSSVVERMAELLRSSELAVSTFVNTINDTPAQTALGSATYVVFGSGKIKERLGDFEFDIGPQSFFQTNTDQAERLYEVVRDAAGLRPSDVVYDLYCGTGTISLYLSPYVRKVIGVEVVADAIEDARANARQNLGDNCSFIAGDVGKLVDPGFLEKHGVPDVLIVDPPRAGLHPRVVEQIASLRAARFVYVSCNPQTQARDLSALSGTYRIDAIQPVDMFPHTEHIESVARLTAIA
jgi:23S rRNA (uracil1939-C5)-methyltransferase